MGRSRCRVWALPPKESFTKPLSAQHPNSPLGAAYRLGA
jgi:hypothetical protein